MSESVIEEYGHSCRIVEEEPEDNYKQYHYEGPMGRIKTFENPDKARLYAQPTMSMQWVSAQFDLPEDRVREYIQSLRNRAEQMRND